MTTIAWGLATGLAAFAAMLVLPTGLGLTPTAMDGVFITAFTATVLGGLDSPLGAVLGGLAVGLVLDYATGYASDPNLAPLAVLGLLLAVLLVRPRGIFSPGPARRV
jgi:branched-chain amino acid transport system permease protein